MCVFILSLSHAFAGVQIPVENQQQEQRYVYKVYYKKLSIGNITRELYWDDNKVNVNAIANLSFLGINFGGSQSSNLYWDEDAKGYITRDFTRESQGFSNVDMSARFSEKGHHSSITNNGEVSIFNNASMPIVDFNAMTLQVSEGLKVGKSDFEFFMQTSDDVAHYFFKVTGKEVINTKFGQFESYRVEQIKKNDRRFVVWFAPELNYQMVSFHYKRKVLDMHGKITEHSLLPL